MTAWAIRAAGRRGRLSLDVDLRGDERVVGMVGPNGSGKTSLLHAWLGTMPLTACEIAAGGVTLASHSRGFALPTEAREVGFVPRGEALFPHLDVLGNVAFGLVVRGRRDAQEVARRTLADLQITDLAHRAVGSLSGGERQRVALARALASSPRLLLLDEPFSALDAVTRHALRRELARHLTRVACTTFLVTHDLRDLEGLAERVIVLREGRVEQDAPYADLCAKPASGFVQALVAAR